MARLDLRSTPRLYLDGRGHLLGQLHVQALLACVETVDHLLVLQLARADHQTGQVAPEELRHAAATACSGRAEEKRKKRNKTQQNKFMNVNISCCCFCFSQGGFGGIHSMPSSQCVVKP